MCKMSESRRCMMMNFDGLDDDDEFFESRDRMSNVRLSNVVSIQFPPRGGSKDEDFDDGRFSFASAAGDGCDDFRSISLAPEDFRNVSFAMASSPVQDYNIWMAEPGSIQDRRQCLLQGMGLMSRKMTRKELMKIASKPPQPQKPPPPAASTSNSSHVPQDDAKKEPSPPPSPPRSPPVKALTRSKSEGSVVSAYVDVKQREETFMDADAKKRLLRLFSLPPSQSDSNLKVRASTIKPSRMKSKNRSKTIGRMVSLNKTVGGALLIKNLDTGKVFLINEDGTASSLSDLQTGKQLTMEEFEKTVGHSPIVKELMRRANTNAGGGGDNASAENEKKSSIYNISKRFSSTKKKAGGGTPAWLKNIRGVANSINGLIGDKEKELPPVPQQSNASTSKWTRVHHHGKSYKEISGLYMCQEIQAHEGSIWTTQFSLDAKFLASAGEDRVIHIWEVVDCDVFSANKATDEATSTPQHPLAGSSTEAPPLAEAPLSASEKRKKMKESSVSKKRSGIPDHIAVPDTVFSLSDKPICSFEGHQDDVLDLSWSKSQQLLSSSMDKTVRLWDLESKSCLKLFAHNDYVTCIQFNPVDDTYFISGSLDEKVRIWSVPDRKVVDWTDLHEMVTAVCYTPDGQGAIVGSHKGTCRMYDLSECKLNQKNELDLQNKKKAAQGKKITGLQFAPGSNSEVLITAADSRIRIFDGPDMVYKFRGFRNTNSQIAAAFSTDGKFVISASEDSQVFIWKRDEAHNANGKTKTLINCQSYERFQCREVSVAIPWPGTIKFDPSLLSPKSKGHAKKNSMSDSVKNSSTAGSLPPLPNKTSNSDRTPSCTEEELSSIAPTESGNEDNASISASTSFADRDASSSISSSSESSSALSWLFDGNSSGRNNLQSTAAWGLVIVTAGQGGELRVYQNFGLPVRGRQASLFASGPLGGSVNKRFL